MEDHLKGLLAFYMVAVIVTGIPSLLLWWGIIAKKYKNVFEGGYFYWMAWFFFCVINFIMLVRIVYVYILP